MSKRTVGKQADNTQEKDTNIQVVVRCREAPTRNAKSNTSIVVAPEFGQDVKIDGPTSAQTYHYDGVFGPKATQEHIYERIVSPILDEVMQGYNCTIFAYGQTGTGKTYTMEGDLDASEVDHGLAVPALPSSNGNSSDLLCHSRLSTRAGVIPRTLHNLFYALDKQSAEYYVRVSYVELYNEELRDLLASNDVPGDAAGLKVFESGTDKGIIIQGLNEMAVTSARDAVAALQAGAQRRAVAATRCNEASSRSHAIFTITVFIRERAVTAEGEDIVKLGKLNLVDLAGSENIGRSGAQDMRAREAGNINKSLLVLGRVITALVEKNSYVPYRDSKLTYIIKDSLGGRTRTCMIATISTSAANIEETVKTLKYARDAKGIRNRPVANMKVTRAEIVHDMQLQMDQLRRDLAAARDETGFYVARETYDALNADVAQARADSADWKQRVALWEAEAQRSATRIAELERAESEATARANALDARNAQLTAELARMQRDLEHQALFTRAHAHHEDALGVAARCLRRSLADASADTAALHEKVAHMGATEQRSLQSAEKAISVAEAEAAAALAAAAALGSRAAEHASARMDALQSRVGAEFESAVEAKVDAAAVALRQELESIQAALTKSSTAAQSDVGMSFASITSIVDNLQSATRTAAVECAETCASLVADITRHTSEQSGALRSSAMAAARRLLEVSTEAAREIVSRAQAESARAECEMRAAAKEQRDRDAAHAEALQRQIAQIQSDARDAAMLAVREVLDRQIVQTSSVLAESASYHANTAEQSTDTLVARSKIAPAAAIETALALAAGVETAHGDLTQRIDADALAAADAGHALAQSAVLTRDRVAARLDENASLAVSVHEETTRFTARICDKVEKLGAAAESSMTSARQSTTESVRELRGVTTKALSTWSKARNGIAGLENTQAAELTVVGAELQSCIADIAQSVRSELTAGVQATATTSDTPSSSKRYSSASWNHTLPHADILARLATNAHNVQLGWTGVPAVLDNDDDRELLPETAVDTESSSPMDVTDDAPPAAVRKRSSDVAVSPASDHVAQRPTRRPRTRTAQFSAIVDTENSDPAVLSEIDDVKLVSGIPMPRRTKRTRG
ncbi:Kinesin- motor protein [Coemansia thaxteri]|uniref:Kinesin- motor protein n=1 Tax=Coemansia thaxteri TaxID=2663907 RepID=A0A9W8ELH1_9FUNG|nr:Kinesin- motor protein [Coemansia thaxteri]KAJ2487705.1 Kinesin- motor protein [Coemansia sp. RSA 2320]